MEFGDYVPGTKNETKDDGDFYMATDSSWSILGVDVCIEAQIDSGDEGNMQQVLG